MLDKSKEKTKRWIKRNNWKAVTWKQIPDRWPKTAKAMGVIMNAKIKEGQSGQIKNLNFKLIPW